MTLLDIAILCFAAALATIGWRQGFIAGVLSLGGFALGAFLGTRIGPHLLKDGSSSPYAPLFGLVGALTGGVVLSLGLEGVGLAVRDRLRRIAGLGEFDGVAGSLLGAALALGIAWVAGAVALQTPGARDLRRDIQRSAILRRLNDVLPPSGGLLNALARFDPLQAINGPDVRVAPPRAAIAHDPDVAAAAPSVVRITGTACGLSLEGSGWVVRDGLVITNAHVVAGESDTVVQLRGSGTKYDATAIAFDPKNDIAVLRVPGIRGRARPLPVRHDPPSGASGAILGFPHNGPYDVEPARIGRTEHALTDDAYGNGPVKRSIVILRGRIRSGNSGGPVVDSRGKVLGTVFAATRHTSPRGGYGVPNAVVEDALSGADDAVGTGSCAP